MLRPEHFQYGENRMQFYYFFENDVTKESVNIIQNKWESFWFGFYNNDSNGEHFLIPVHTESESSVMLELICEWYNNGKKRREVKVPPAVEVKTISKSLMDITDMYGNFPVQAAKRIQAYLEDPCIERWDDIHGIFIDGENTVWQLLTEIDDTFPREGPSTDITGQKVEDWKRIPQPLEVLRAIKHGVNNKKEVGV